MDLFQNGKSLGNAISEDDLVAMMDSQTGDRGYAKVSDLVTGGMTTLNEQQRAAVRAGIGIVVSAEAPVDADGRPEGTIYIQTGA